MNANKVKGLTAAGRYLDGKLTNIPTSKQYREMGVSYETAKTYKKILVELHALEAVPIVKLSVHNPSMPHIWKFNESWEDAA